MTQNTQIKKTLAVIGTLLHFSLFSLAIEHPDTIIVSQKSEDTENILQLSAGWHQLKDTYLSSLPYHGYEINIENQWWNKYHTGNNLYHNGRIRGKYASTSNNKSNAISLIEIEGGWGTYYKYSRNGFSINIGPYMNTYLSAKQIAANYNKPANVDFAVDINAHLFADYKFKAKKTSYRLRYEAQINILGTNFAPDYWESYYGIDKKLQKNFFFTSWANKVNLSHGLYFDSQLLHSTWRIGFRHEYRNLQHQYQKYIENNISIVVGTVFNYQVNGKVRLTE